MFEQRHPTRIVEEQNRKGNSQEIEETVIARRQDEQHQEHKSPSRDVTEGGRQEHEHGRDQLDGEHDEGRHLVKPAG